MEGKVTGRRKMRKYFRRVIEIGASVFSLFLLPMFLGSYEISLARPGRWIS